MIGKDYPIGHARNLYTQILSLFIRPKSGDKFSKFDVDVQVQSLKILYDKRYLILLLEKFATRV